MRPNSKYFDRVISEADLTYLIGHRLGLARRAKGWRWRIATEDTPANLTLADFGIGLPPEPSTKPAAPKEPPAPSVQPDFEFIKGIPF
jgi:hypothetical protein